ncbi:MAG: phosphatase PAP2 family protein [Cytophagia bacterium]|nr:MAG: phosphatase PAP2 family protein [Cytophagia bacterium]
MKKTLLITLFIYFFLGALLIIFFKKGQFELWLNQQHHSFFDFLFYYITFIGDGLFSILMVILMLFYRWRIAVLIGITFAISGLLSLFLKQIVFPIAPRPAAFFDELKIQNIYYVLSKQSEISFSNSFPSGHTTTTFALLIVFCLWGKTEKYTIFWIFLAFLVALSRVYLLQHFWIDTYFGALLGTMVSVLVYLYSKKKKFIL